MKSRRLKPFPFFLCLLFSIAGLAGAAPVADSARIQDVVRLRVQYQMDTVELRKVDGSWKVAGSGFPAVESFILKGLGALFSLHTREFIASKKGEDALSEYGLNREEGHFVEVGFKSGKPLRLRMARAPDQATYWKLESRPEIYRVPALTWAVPAEASYWIDRRLLGGVNYTGDVQSIAARWTDSAGQEHSYKIVRMPDTMVRLVEPFEHAVPRQKASFLFAEAPQLVTDAFLEPTEIARQGPEAPVTVTIESRQGAIQTLKTEGSAGLHYYVKHPGNGRLVKVLRGRFDVFKRTPEELSTMPVHGPEPYDGIHQTIPPGYLLFTPYTDGHADDAHEEPASP
ncbi:MAG: hypothetical protein K0Q91_1851 [Fibrobacteria bacterium]|nr:hypothetical protein [Fibrobacteria bacterium]